MAKKKNLYEPLYPDLFDVAWSLYPKRPGNNKRAAVEAWNARINEGVDPSRMIAGVKRYAAYVKAADTRPGFIKLTATFFGPKHHYDDDYGWDEYPAAEGTPRKAEQDLLRFYAEEQII